MKEEKKALFMFAIAALVAILLAKGLVLNTTWGSTYF